MEGALTCTLSAWQAAPHWVQLWRLDKGTWTSPRGTKCIRAHWSHRRFRVCGVHFLYGGRSRLEMLSQSS